MNEVLFDRFREQKRRWLSLSKPPSVFAERMGFEPMNRFWRLHTFQACAFDQLGHLSNLTSEIAK